jgi:DNA-directed RNA polymerase beta' subunit
MCQIKRFLLHRGFTVGIQDCAVDITKTIDKIIDKTFVEAKDTEHSISHENLRELKVCSILNEIRDQSMKLTKNEFKSDNAFVATVTSGSKGEFFNITQITGMLGQQMHMNQRIQKTINKGRRTLPHYPVENLTIDQEFESRGFIKNSFLHGINPQEFLWHAMTGREGCSDKHGVTNRWLLRKKVNNVTI